MLLQADHTRQVVLKHEAAVGSWASAIAEAQVTSERLQTECDAQEASAVRQGADLCAALEGASSQAAVSVQHSLQVLAREAGHLQKQVCGLLNIRFCWAALKPFFVTRNRLACSKHFPGQVSCKSLSAAFAAGNVSRRRLLS
jgi:hypothetical protein